MSNKFIDTITQKGTRFVIIFIAIFMGLYFLFQTPFMVKMNQTIFKSSFDFFLTSTFSELEIWTEAKNPEKPFLFTMNFYGKREFEIEKEKTIKAGKTAVNIITKQNDFEGNYLPNLYLPFLLALFIATPLAWRSKIPALLVGTVLYWVILMYIFMAKVALVIDARGIDPYHYEGTQKMALQNIETIANAGFFSVLVIFIWFVTIVLFNKQNDFFKSV